MTDQKPARSKRLYILWSVALGLIAAGSLFGCEPGEEPPPRKRVVAATFSGLIWEEKALAREVERARRKLARFGARKQYLGSMCWHIWVYEEDEAEARRVLAKAQRQGRYKHLWPMPENMDRALPDVFGGLGGTKPREDSPRATESGE